MNTPNFNITIRFYEELNYFLKKYPKKQDIQFSFNSKRSIKDLIESFGIPHVEVDMILVNGKSVDFSYIVQNKDRISVYPVFESLNIKNTQKLRAEPLRETKFILDVHLGKLAKNLIILGFDSIYNNSLQDKELAEISLKENRILLTRDRGLLKRKVINHGFIIKKNEVIGQTVEVLNRLDLWEKIKPFTRCIHCNGNLQSVKKEDIANSVLKIQVPDKILNMYNEFSKCVTCNKVYWKGTHYLNLISKINLLKIYKQ